MMRMLVYLLTVCWFESVVSAEPLWSVQCTGTTAPHCTLHSGKIPGADAWGLFQDTINTTGWAVFQVSTRPPTSLTDDVASYAAGYLEGALTQQRIYEQYHNMASFLKVPVPAKLQAFLDANDAWVAQQTSTATTSEYWAAVRRVYAQMDGIVVGYNSRRPIHPLNRTQILLINLQGDIMDILAAVDPSRRPDISSMSPAELQRYDLLHSHCSAIIKLLPDGSDLYVSHTMWWMMYAMIRVAKVYRLPVGANSTNTIMMSGYPGTLASTDDFYQMPDTGMVTLETTNPLYNMSLYDLVHPSSLFYFVRVLVSNQVARSGEEWMLTMELHNSGTYNNMWMAVDYKRFTPGKSLVPGTLWVGEQIPGYFHYEDQTHVLTYGYWPSYNKALYPVVSARIGQDDMVAKHGSSFSYQLTARAEIFRRDQGKVEDLEDLQRLIRSNHYKTDPLAHGQPCNQLSCRGDLANPPFTSLATDGKATSSKHLSSGQFRLIAGPTHESQPIFCWSTAPDSLKTKVPHVGHPDCFDFDWEVLTVTVE